MRPNGSRLAPRCSYRPRPSGDREAEQGVQHGGDGEVRQPQAVEPGGLERLGELRHVWRGDGSGVRAEGEADLHSLTA